MTTLSPRAPERNVDEPHENDARRIVELVAAWGLARDQKRHEHLTTDEALLRFDGFDHAHITVADVWKRRT